MSLVTCDRLVKALVLLNYETFVLILEEVRIVHVNHSLNLEKGPSGIRPWEQLSPQHEGK